MKSLLSAAAILACSLRLAALSLAQSGSLDFTFNPGSGETQPSTYCIAVQTNGCVLIGGDFTSFNGATCIYLARLNADASVDSSFGPTLPGGPVQALAVQQDGNILVGGGFSSVNGLPRNGVARLRTDGSVDTGFAGAGPAGMVMALALQHDGKVVIGGDFGVARLNTNGTLDATFNPGAGLAPNGGYVDALGVQSDGGIIIGGDFTTVNGLSRIYLARLNADGSVDTTFDAGIALGTVYSKVVSIAVLPQDKLVFGGDFAGVNGYSRNYIARLNADGSVDTRFDPGLGPDFIVTGVAVKNDGKVVIGGGFSHVNGTNRVGVARLNTDGSLDLAFNPGTGADNVDCVASQPDGRTLIGGEFTRFNGTNISGIVRLNGDAALPAQLQFMAPNLYFGTRLYGTVSNTYRVEWTANPNAASLWTPLLNVTLQTNPQFIVDPSPAGGQRFYRAVQISP